MRVRVYKEYERKDFRALTFNGDNYHIDLVQRHDGEYNIYLNQLHVALTGDEVIKYIDEMLICLASVKKFVKNDEKHWNKRITGAKRDNTDSNQSERVN